MGKRCEQDSRFLVGLFFVISDEINNLDLKEALQQLAVDFFRMHATSKKRDKSALMSQVLQWIATVPSTHGG